MQQGTITVHPSIDGTPTVRWELKAPAAEAVLTMLARAALAEPDSDAIALLDHLATALSEAEALAEPLRMDGCAGLWPDAEPVALSSPAVLLGDTGDLCSVLLPGNVPALEAITAAIDEANATGAEIDRTNTSLMADVHRARWVLLHECGLDEHDFHPEVAAAGSMTPGAVLVTQVNFTYLCGH